MTAQEFLAWDAHETVKREFVRGEVFPMAGADERHNTVVGNVVMALRAQLRGTPCRVLMLDMKLRVEAADCFYYPDVLVTCSAADTDPLVKREAVLVVEVLSPLTAAFDRGDKFADYRLLPSLREYLLLDPDKRRGDLYRQGNDGLWVLHPFGTGEAVRLDSVGLALEAQVLWEDVTPGAPQGSSA
ncbi:Uma2 family endonuclease [Azohydromonas sp. G-1-1-14]|uniref:Uma2 family endonuclease n=2 Tax=Azohydromonas caseinilytica TaxID=2728836 RepID=A0A848F471_9BURK|nr:Uma2 family endonuclease [Azohydromonas caseinilytica]